MTTHTYSEDRRIVMTLDAGGTNLKFSAVGGSRVLMTPVVLPSRGDDLEQCIGNMVEGFECVKRQVGEAPVAISMAIPGPANYPMGILMNVGNLPAFRGGFPLGAVLEDRFGIPVFLNNDGDLFVYGEAIAGFLPWVNGLLEKAGSPKRYRNLFGLTLGTGLGGGIVRDGELLAGDNSAGGEAWLLRDKLDPTSNAEEGASIRAVRRAYAEQCGIPFEQAPEPKEIFEIGIGSAAGNRAAAAEAFRRMGEVAGDVLAQALTLIDGLAVIGGGISAAHPLFLQPIVDAMNSKFDGSGHRRLIAQAFNIEDPAGREAFLKGDVREVAVPGSGRILRYDPLPRTAVGISRLGTSEAVAIGAYAFALRELAER